MKSLSIAFTARSAWTLILGIAMSVGASAQTWYASHGGMGIEQGRGGVKVLAGGAGFISVGSSTSGPTGTSDVYVVKTNPAGGIIWANTYDFGGHEEVGYDIVELVGGGFAVTGAATVGVAGFTDAFIMTLTTTGAVTGMAVLGGPGNDEGHDIIQLTAAGAPNDLVVAGVMTNVAGNTDGLLIRVPLPLCPVAPVFMKAYWTGAAMTDYFNGLWEATSGGPAGTAVGDLIVCGASTGPGGTIDGWVMRTDVAGLPIWSRLTGGPGASAEVFNSVVQLTVPATPGAIVAVGSTTGVLPGNFYMAKFFGSTGAQILPDVSGGPAGSYTEMFSVRENQVVNPGHLILAGYTSPGGIGAEDAYAVEMVPGWGCPVWKAWSREYGGAIGNERFYSGEEATVGCTNGYIFCGHTTSPTLLPGGDPQNMYLVRTNALGATGCQITPVDNCTNPNYATYVPGIFNAAAGAATCGGTTTFAVVNNLVLCFTPCPINREHDGGNDGIAGVAAPDESDESANLYPNPVVAGADFIVEYTVGESAGSEAHLLVSDITGKAIFERDLDATGGLGRVAIGTSQWPVGTYLVKVSSKGASQTKRVVVIDK